MAQQGRNNNGGHWSHEVLPGALQCPPKNIGPNDQVQCTFSKCIGRGMQTVYCNKPMEICRINTLCPYKIINCSACQQEIVPQTQFVALCRCAYDHTNGKYNIICCKCLELESKINQTVPKVARGSQGRNKELWHIKKNFLRRRY